MMHQLNDWLQFFVTNHPNEIDLGLDRIKIVAERLNILKFSIPIITVTGTNGKGSTVATLESIYTNAGYNVGVFSSPFLLRYNEQIRINKQEIDDNTLCDCFAKIYSACKEISLSGFEFLTLAALLIFQHKNLDVIILEVGMGGKRDAVNIVDPSLAIITNVALEHQQWLGNNREEIGAEKAGILRQGIPAIIGETNPPQSIIAAAKTLEVTLYLQHINFFFQEKISGFDWEFCNKKLTDLPLPKLALTNVANALMAIELLQPTLPITTKQIKNALINLKLPGRFQVIHQPVLQIFDVAHNPAGINLFTSYVKKFLADSNIKTVRAVFSMLKDKDITNSILPCAEIVDEWYIAPVSDKRTATINELKEAFSNLHIANIQEFKTIKDAYLSAIQDSNADDLIIIYGSFRTVAEALQQQQAATFE